MADDASSLPVIAVTAAVGAVVLLFALLCSIGRGEKKSENEGKPRYNSIVVVSYAEQNKGELVTLQCCGKNRDTSDSSV